MLRRKNKSRESVSIESLIRRIALESTLSRSNVKVDPHQKWEQYFKKGWRKPTNSLKSWDEVKYFL